MFASSEPGYADPVQTLTFKLIPKIDDALKADVIKWSALYEHRIRMGSVSNFPVMDVKN